jgi:hypothetical protein
MSELGPYLALAERKALVSLAAGKWDRFGYWAAHSVHLRKLTGQSRTSSPFAPFVKLAERILGADAQRDIDWVAAQDDPSQMALPSQLDELTSMVGDIADALRTTTGGTR